MASDIQFYGKSKVLQAYDARGVSCWSLWQGNDFLQTGDTKDELDTYLTMLGGSKARYQLRVHKDVTADEIDNKTACHGSFRFLLTDNSTGNGVGVVNGQPQTLGVVSLLQQKIEAKIADRLEKVFDRIDEEDKEPSFSDIAMGYLKDPQALAGIIGAVRGMLMPSPAIPAMAVGNVERVGTTEKPKQSAEDEEKEMEQLYAIYQRIKLKDPQILEHLAQLADISEKNPGMFSMILNSLNNLRV